MVIGLIFFFFCLLQLYVIRGFEEIIITWILSIPFSSLTLQNARKKKMRKILQRNTQGYNTCGGGLLVGLENVVVVPPGYNFVNIAVSPRNVTLTYDPVP